MPHARPVGRFPKTQRLRRRSEFAAVQAGNRRVVTPHFVLLIHARRDPATTSEPVRLGVVASRKIGNAVHRNRAKRLVREAFRATRDLWASGTDLVVIVRGPLTRMKLDDVVSELRADSKRIERRSRDALADAAPRSEQRG